jgi:hypothetical protein
VCLHIICPSSLSNAIDSKPLTGRNSLSLKSAKYCWPSYRTIGKTRGTASLTVFISVIFSPSDLPSKAKGLLLISREEAFVYFFIYYSRNQFSPAAVL